MPQVNHEALKSQYRKEGAIVGLPLYAIVGYLLKLISGQGDLVSAHAERIARAETEYAQVDKSIEDLRKDQKERAQELDHKLDRVLDKIDQLNQQQRPKTSDEPRRRIDDR